jgi:coproporphyrinogen III oxidase
MATQASPMRERFEAYILSLQDTIVTAFEDLDSDAPKFKRDSWLRPQGGKGQSCVYPPSSSHSISHQAHESVLEKAGVNISVVHGLLPPAAIKQMRADHSSIPFNPDNPTSLPFFAAGISLVIHPRNPNAPTVHANYRYFEITEHNSDQDGQSAGGTGKVLAWWFGGGSDLTPSYLFEDDARLFHRTLKEAFGPEYSTGLFPVFKKWCDEYFYIPHRSESRGIGGIFFDDLSQDVDHKRIPSEVSRPRSSEDIFKFIQNLGNAFIPSYLPILSRRMTMPGSEHQRRWQLLRRGRYVEFNLVYDRGTKFGLNTPGARIESILMSLPETARWEYMSDLGGDGEGSEEGKLVEVLKQPKDWA